MGRTLGSYLVFMQRRQFVSAGGARPLGRGQVQSSPMKAKGAALIIGKVVSLALL